MTSLQASGYKAVFLSVDTPLLGRRLNEYRNNFVLPDDMNWPNLLSDGKSELSGQTKDARNSKHDFGKFHRVLPREPWLICQTRRWTGPRPFHG
jgi:(S)-2-hydroxy-acid oxidase